MPKTNIEPRIRGRAQALRRNPTDAERKMWWLLRSMKPLGMHFRRQAPIGRYIADFAWHSGKIVIEPDGSQHADARRGYDSWRTAWLQSQGYQVLRFWNIDVLKSPQSVGEAIFTAVQERTGGASQYPTPTPPHEGEEFHVGASRGSTL
jgi:very-short-patch-repair endonuclease